MIHWGPHRGGKITHISGVYGLIWACCNGITKDVSAELALAGTQDPSFPAFGESLSRLYNGVFVLNIGGMGERQRAVWLQLPQKNNSINPINDQSCLFSCFPEVICPHFAALS